MSILSIVLLILLGILLILVELLVIPGITVAGIGGFLMIAGGVFCGYYFHGSTTGNYILLGTGVTLILLLVLALKLKTWQRFGLKSTIEGKVSGIDKEIIKPGDEGKTVSRLAPIGKAMIHDKLFEVRSDGSYINSSTNIIITRIEGNKIFVETKN
jgi:membrane-bound ClpP family serine protease